MSGSTPLVLQVENLRPSQAESAPGHPGVSLELPGIRVLRPGLHHGLRCRTPQPSPVSLGEGEEWLSLPAGLLPLHPSILLRPQELPLTSVGGGGLNLD